MDPDVEHRLSERMRRAQMGDRPAYEAFLAEILPLLRRFVRARLHALDHVEDVVQETLLSLHHHRHTYDPSRPVSPWVYGIARNRLLDFVAKRRRLGAREVPSLLDAESALGGATVEASGAGQLAMDALALLPNPQREIIEWLKVDGYSVAEISSRTGRSQSSVKVMAHRGYKALRKLLEGPLREE